MGRLKRPYSSDDRDIYFMKVGILYKNFVGIY